LSFADEFRWKFLIFLSELGSFCTTLPLNGFIGSNLYRFLKVGEYFLTEQGFSVEHSLLHFIEFDVVKMKQFVSNSSQQ